MKKFLRALTLTAGVAAMLGTSALQAAIHRSQIVQIPFAFKVQQQELPAGTYRIVHQTGDAIAALVNVKTGKRVQLLHPAGVEIGKTRLVFEHNSDGYILKKLV
jgi:hypothetical protein